MDFGVLDCLCLVLLALFSGSERRSINPGSPMGQPWVPDFWGATVGSRTKIVNRGSPRPLQWHCEGVDETSAALACEGVDENARAWTKTRGNPDSCTGASSS